MSSLRLLENLEIIPEIKEVSKLCTKIYQNANNVIRLPPPQPPLPAAAICLDLIPVCQVA